MFRAKEDGRPSLAHSQADSGSDSEGSEAEKTPATPLTKEDLRAMLRETSADIKAYTAAALEKQITGLKKELEVLTSRTDHNERLIKDTQTKTTALHKDTELLQDRMLYLEDGLEDLNNRSRRQNIRIRGIPETVLPDAILPTIKAIFQSLLPNASDQELYIERAHRALRPPTYNPNTPRDIITKLLYFPVKEQLMKAARSHQPTYQDQQIHFYQDLAPTTLKKRRELKPLTTALIESGWRYMWGHPFKLSVKKGEQSFTLHQVADMQDFADHLGITLRYPAQDPNQATKETASHRGGPRTLPTRPQPKRGSPPTQPEQDDMNT
ncbi:Hypothetical predicted protein [Pelobates cultripes]|uniref:Uncharacterized protein n=1 Tax=Pelobates cultripes TaxID=61616 RepID=A0AAD1SLT3_PELCU|nr:Hypothetical predicted protein [Pelobates cultripes]